jgi:hypothetical protein
MNRTLSSTWFLVATALCCGLTVAFASWLADESSNGVRALAALSGLGFGLAIMLLIAWVLDEEDTPAVSRPAEPAPPGWVTAARAPTPATRPSSPQPTELRESAPAVLTVRLEEGRALREQLQPGASDARVAAWIESVRHSLERERPGVVGYFNALGTRVYADDVERLDAHLGRLATIVRDFL